MIPKPGQPRPPLFALFFISIFGFVGVAVLIFLWGSGDGMHAPPLFFKVFASFIALGFIAMGFGLPLAAIKLSKTSRKAGKQPVKSIGDSDYDCPNCGANVQDAEVSPSGDVKCPYCKGWWNIHRG